MVIPGSQHFLCFLNHNFFFSNLSLIIQGEIRHLLFLLYNDNDDDDVITKTITIAITIAIAIAIAITVTIMIMTLIRTNIISISIKRCCPGFLYFRRMYKDLQVDMEKSEKHWWRKVGRKYKYSASEFTEISSVSKVTSTVIQHLKFNIELQQITALLEASHACVNCSFSLKLEAIDSSPSINFT